MPGLDAAAAVLVNQGYLDQIVEVDLPRVAERRRDPVKLRRVLSALARSVGNQVSVSKLANEAVATATLLIVGRLIST